MKLTNDVLIYAVERAIALLKAKKFISRRTRSRLAKDKEYFRRFLELALDPSVTKEDMSRELKLSNHTINKHLAMLSVWLDKFISTQHALKDEGLGWDEEDE